MSESKEAPSKCGWITTAVAALASALSGALLMYASPFLDMVIKPAKPLANFECQVNGLKATFQNKSTGAHEGLWDFGDGTALEPFVPEQTTITHTYVKSGDYMVKLALKNIIDEENERTVTLYKVGEDSSSEPSIDLNVVAVHGNYAPALFRVETKVKNASQCVWVVGNRNIEFDPDTAKDDWVRLVTINEPGTHVIRVAAFNGKKTVEKTATVVVQAPPAGSITATLNVTYQAVFVEQKPASPVVQMTFPMNQMGDVITLTKSVLPEIGFAIVKADVLPQTKNPYLKSSKVQLDPAKHGQALVTCELVRPSARSAPPVCTVQLAVVQQRQSAPTLRSMDPVAVNLAVPGSTLVPLPELPAGWVAKTRSMTLTLQQAGKQYAYKDVMPHNVAVQMSPTSQFIVNTVEQAGQLRIDMQALKNPLNMFGN
jgi:PKD repeat protein